MGFWKWASAGVAVAGVLSNFTKLSPFGNEAGLGLIALGGAGFFACAIIEK